MDRGARYRPDIDGLRAVAVLAVVVFHALPEIGGGGFTGVDIFFVISGYLISGNIFSGLSSGDFSFRDFYTRRVRRIFPALVVVLAALSVAGWFLFTTDEYTLLGKHVAAGSAFLANFALWAEHGYFDQASSSKPLLHLWSLGVEEQFYIVWPLLLWVSWRLKQNVPAIIAAIGMLSFAANIHEVAVDSVFAFYSPMTRLWELLLGAFLAHRENHRHAALNRALAPDALSVVGWLLLCAGFLLIRQGNTFPGWWALLPTLGAVCLIAAGPTGLINRIVLGNPWLVAIGVISYPLYLWHWPLLTIARLELQRLPPVGIRALVIAMSFALAWATYRLVERPLRFGSNGGAKAILLSAGMACVLVLGVRIEQTAGFETTRSALFGLEDLRAQLWWPYSRTRACLKRFPYDTTTVEFWFCAANRDAPPDLLILGNSFANSLYPGLVDNASFKNASVADIGACFPVMSVDMISPYLASNHPCVGAQKRREQRFISQIIDSSPSIHLVLLDALWPTFDGAGEWVDERGDYYGKFEEMRPGGSPPGESSMQVFMAGLERRISFLQSHGLQMVIFLPKPSLGYDIRSCFPRPLFSKPARSCIVRRAQALEQQAGFREIVRKIAKRYSNLHVFDEADAFCDGDICDYAPKGVPLLRDSGHLSVAGSKKLGEDFANWLRASLPMIAQQLRNGDGQLIHLSSG